MPIEVVATKDLMVGQPVVVEGGRPQAASWPCSKMTGRRATSMR